MSVNFDRATSTYQRGSIAVQAFRFNDTYANDGKGVLAALEVSSAIAKAVKVVSKEYATNRPRFVANSSASVEHAMGTAAARQSFIQAYDSVKADARTWEEDGYDSMEEALLSSIESFYHYLGVFGADTETKTPFGQGFKSEAQVIVDYAHQVVMEIFNAKENAPSMEG